MQTAILIPAFCPDSSLLMLVTDLQRLCRAPILIVDDGSGPAYRPVFEALSRAGCQVVTHQENYGKGAALKTGICALRKQYPYLGGIITADADGQHLPSDIAAVQARLQKGGMGLVLGERSFSGRGVPLRSRVGNGFSALFFHMSTGTRCPDTQTGLRGIPRSLFALACAVPGSRYEYEMNFLTEVAQKGIPLECVHIHTVYAASRQPSHFHTLRDSVRIFRTPLRYLCASLTGAAVDLSLFALLDAVLPTGLAMRLVAATAGARIVSGIVNFLLNRHWSFAGGHTRSGSGQAARYALLFLCQMLCSGSLVTLLAFVPAPAVALKIPVDCALFIVSYFLQKYWVFAEPAKRKVKRNASL
jgi:putative flippase GtrA